MHQRQVESKPIPRVQESEAVAEPSHSSLPLEASAKGQESPSTIVFRLLLMTLSVCSDMF